MSRVWAIWKKELRSYFNSPIAYLFIVIVLWYTALTFFIWGKPLNFWIRGEAGMKEYFSAFPLVLGFLVPALCMRLWPEERKTGTIEILMTMPVRAWEVVLGKYFAMTSIVALTLLLSITVPWSVNSLAKDGMDMGPVVGGYVGAFLMGSAYCAVGMFMSAFVREQVVALLAALAVCLPLAVAGTPLIDIFTPDGLSAIGRFVGFTVRFESIEKGVLDVRDMFYFASFSVLFVFLNVTVLEYRRLR